MIAQHEAEAPIPRLPLNPTCLQAKLVPTDQVTVYYNIATSSEYLLSIAEKHSTYISTSIKAPFLKGDCIMGQTIIEESTQVTFVVWCPRELNQPKTRILDL